MRADNTAANHADAAGRNAGHAAQQDARATFGASHSFTGRFDGQAPSDFAHRGQQGQGAAVVSYGFISDRRAAGFDQALGLLRIGCQVEVGKEDLTFAQLHPFAGLRFLDLYDHFRFGKNFLGAFGDFGACLFISLVASHDSCASTRLDQHLMTARNIFADSRRGQPDAIFMNLDFGGDADAHKILS